MKLKGAEGRLKGYQVVSNPKPGECALEDPAQLFGSLKLKPLFHDNRVRFSISFSCELWEDYEIYKFLGGGSGGQVYEARRVSTTNEEATRNRQIALKFVDPNDKELAVICETEDEAFEHRNLVRYRACIEKTNVLTPGKVHGLIIMDVGKNGALIDWCRRAFNFGLISQRYYFPEAVVRRVMLDLVAGLSHLVKKGVSHRDIKCDNVFIDAQGRFVLGDFGHARVITSSMRHGMSMEAADPIHIEVGTKGCNPPEMLCPELVKNRNAHSFVYDSEKADVFQLGTLLFTLLTGLSMWHIPSKEKFKGVILDSRLLKREHMDRDGQNTGNKTLWDRWDSYLDKCIDLTGDRNTLGPMRISNSCRQLLNRMLSYDPSLRPTFAELRDLKGDERLDWLSRHHGVCSLKELYDELYNRGHGAKATDEVTYFMTFLYL